MNWKWWSPKMVNLTTPKECYLSSTKDYMKTGLFGCGMSDSDCINKLKEWQSTNGNALTYKTAINFSQWLFRIRNKEKTTSVDKQF